MPDPDYPVIIAGAGPVGLSLAVGLAHHGVRSLVLEKKEALSPHSRALLVTTRTLEAFRAWGIQDAFMERGHFVPRLSVWAAGRAAPEVTLDLDAALSRHSAVPGVVLMAQDRTEAVLLEQARATGMAEVRFGEEVTGFEQDEVGVAVAVQRGSLGPDRLTAEYLMGCDGAHSTVRARLGWGLEGKTYPARIVLADVRLEDERDALPWPRVAAIPGGFLAAIRFDPEEWRIIRPVPTSEPDEVATSPEAVRQYVEAAFGPGPFETLWSSAFHIHCRNSPHFVSGRVVLAGDAAHLNSPAGGQGMNAGIHDAHNLAWKLARALDGGDAPALLLSYEQERRGAVIGTVDRITDFLTRFVFLPHPAVRTVLLSIAKNLVTLPTVQEQMFLRLGMLTTRYGASALLRGGGALVGARAPDAELARADGSRTRLLDRVSPDALLVLFDDGRLPNWNVEEVRSLLSAIPGVQVARVRRSDAGTGADEAELLLDADGALFRKWNASGDAAALIRPDGHVGWSARRPGPEALRDGVATALGVLPAAAAVE